MNYVNSLDLFGVNAKQIPATPGEGEPTTATEGAVGCLYMDTTNGDLYKCTAVIDGVYKWMKQEGGGAGTGDGGATDPYNDYQPDVPENIGVLNAILNAKQLAEIPLKLLAALPQKAGNWAPRATPYNGLPYSSSRIEEGFVPNFVSLYTFMTALQNPNSYLYTVDLGEKYNNNNGTTYYGTVCSVFCAYALNIIPNYTTHQWQDIPSMELVPWQSVYALKLGDTICHHTSGHVVMVTNITRNKRGKIGKITITEAATVKVKVTEYTPEELAAAYPTEDYAFHRYSKINEVQHIQSPFVAVEDETPMEFTYNTALIPRKGDKANWLQGVPVEIDLLAKSGYNAVEVYKDDVLFKTEQIGGGVERPVDRTIYMTDWLGGSLSSSNNTSQFHTNAIPSVDFDITVAEGAKVKIGFYDETGSNLDVTDEWLTGTVSARDYAPAATKYSIVAAAFADEKEITDEALIVGMITLRVPANVDKMPVVLKAGTLSSSNGEYANNNARGHTDFQPLQNIQIAGSDKVQYYIYYYDVDKNYLSNNGVWLSGTANVMDGAPAGTAYYRLVVKNIAGTTISSTLAQHSIEITATILGGATEGSTDCIVLNDLEYGSYKARLTDGENHSDWCHWIVVDAFCAAVSGGVGSRQATVTFSARNAEPLFVKWAGGNPSDSGYHGTKHINVLTPEQIAAGEAVVKYETTFNDSSAGKYKLRVAFQTEYGIIHTPLPEAITV